MTTLFDKKLIDLNANLHTNNRLEEKRAFYTDAWLKLARGDDFLGVQNYESARVGDQGDLAPSADVPKSTRGAKIYPAARWRRALRSGAR